MTSSEHVDKQATDNNPQPTKRLGGITGKGFMPGVSGNPAGPPAKATAFKEKCRKRGDEYLEELDRIVKDPNTKQSTKVDIMKFVIEHGFGKATPLVMAEAEEVRILVMDK